MKKIISIVIPIYNEEAIIDRLYSCLIEVTDDRIEEFEFIFINDGSKDRSLDKLLKIKKKDDRICILDFSRNFGHQNALTAGLDEAKGDAVILMDADMEDPPSAITKFIEKWYEGYQVVYALRRRRQTSFFKSLLFKLFHKINSRISLVAMEAAGIFGLMDRVVVDNMISMKEYNRYVPGLRSWVGFKQIGIEVDRGARYDNTPRVSMLRLYKLAFDSFTSFSDGLLSLPLVIGAILFLLSLISLLVIVILKLFFGLGPWGWTSMVSIILLISGLQFSFIGLIGEYISRIMIEVKERPLYIIKKKY